MISGNVMRLSSSNGRLMYIYDPVEAEEDEGGGVDEMKKLSKARVTVNGCGRRSLLLQCIFWCCLLLTLSSGKSRWRIIQWDEEEWTVRYQNDTLLILGRDGRPRNDDVVARHELSDDTDTSTDGNYKYPEGWPQSYRKDPSTMANRQTGKEICFVHIGKTAGSTLSCYLGFLNNRCLGSDQTTAIPMAPGLLPVLTTHMTHVGWDDCKHQPHFDYYLYVVRDPLKRIQSWFTYEHPNHADHRKHANETYYLPMKELYMDCNFDTLEQLADIGLSPIPDKSELGAVCQERARQAISGKRGFLKHNKYNFDYYYRHTRKKELPFNSTFSKLVVIRTEHLYDDWKSVEEDVLDGPRGLNVTFEKRNSSEKRPEDTFLSATSQERLCRLLCNEIQIYKQLLEHAVNLNDGDLKQSLQELEGSCPIEAAATTCEQH